MIKFDRIDTHGWEAAIRGMRNPMNSWGKSDSLFGVMYYHEDDTICAYDLLYGEGRYIDTDDKEYKSLNDYDIYIGRNDHSLMMKLAKAGSEHSKYRRFITVTMDITAPLYWWKEFDTYKVGTVANSCSTMHKIHEKEFELEDFSYEHLFTDNLLRVFHKPDDFRIITNKQWLMFTCDLLNEMRLAYLKTNDKQFWWQMIQLLPSSYNQRRTVMLNYEVLAHIYQQRKNHKLDEWHEFCDMIKTLPYSEIITLEEGVK